MKTPIIILICILVLSCSDNGTIEPEPLKVIKTTTLHAYDFATNFFILDTAYESICEDYYSNYIPVIPNSEKAKYYRIKEIEVWESTKDVKQGTVSAWGVAFAYLNPIKTLLGEKYTENMKNSEIYMGDVERYIWLKMDSTDYTIDNYIGIISIKNLRADRFYAVSYRIEGETTSKDDDLFYGNFSSQILENDTIILKLIYRPNMQPGFRTLWERQLKNKYYVGETNIDISNAEVKICWMNENNDTLEYLNDFGDKLVDILNVDWINNSTGAPPPDGKFDLRAGIFDKENGIISFPSLEPFRKGLIDWALKNNVPEEIYKYIFHEVYDTTYDVARRSEKDKYLIIYNKLGK